MGIHKCPDDLLGQDGLFKALKKALVERALNSELTEHLGSDSVKIEYEINGIPFEKKFNNQAGQ
ncbi:MAG: hypothetical protein HRU28_15805 [Rhizobiales bacterium]|nr:hypothetical protein [Hyphomicrobiales bacterium]